MPDTGFAILPGCDVADDLAVIFSDKNARRIASDVNVNMHCLSPSPIVAVDDTELLLDAIVDRNADESFGGEALQMIQIARLIGADMHVCNLRLCILDFGLEAAVSWNKSKIRSCRYTDLNLQFLKLFIDPPQ